MQLTWANILTLARLFLAPVFLLFALSDHPTGITIAAIIFAIAAASDWLGYDGRRAAGDGSTDRDAAESV